MGDDHPKTEQLDFDQPFNRVEYTCGECGNEWVDSAIMEAFEERREDYGSYVLGEWHTIMRSVVENKFRRSDQLLDVVCPHCAAENELATGDIAAFVVEQGPDREEMEAIREAYPDVLEAALSRLFHAGLQMRDDGRLEKR